MAGRKSAKNGTLLLLSDKSDQIWKDSIKNRSFLFHPAFEFDAVKQCNGQSSYQKICLTPRSYVVATLVAVLFLPFSESKTLSPAHSQFHLQGDGIPLTIFFSVTCIYCYGRIIHTAYVCKAQLVTAVASKVRT